VKQFIKDYFSFNKRERNGLFILLLILVIIIIAPYVISVFIQKENVDFSAFRKDIAKFERSLKETTEENKDSFKYNEFDYNNVNRSVAENMLHPFNFNPNNLPAEKWKEMGLNDKQIKIIKNFETKGGKFFKKEDLKKIYGITESDYTVLEPYIQIPGKNKAFDKKEKVIYKNDKNTEIIELNSADTTDLKRLKGIGTWFAKKIIAYRNKLGGFYKKEQLMEVKGIDSSRYAGFISYVSVNSFRITTININTALYDELKMHPYIGFNIALSIINIRNVHGKFASVADIKKSALITDKIYEKLSPYLTVN